MTIESISQEEFRKVYRQRGGKIARPEWDAVRALAPGTGVRFPCSWHHKKSGCAGVISLGTLRTQTGFHLRGTCHDGFVSVWRDA